MLPPSPVPNPDSVLARHVVHPFVASLFEASSCSRRLAARHRLFIVLLSVEG
ncbi:uncharacterized protein DS421_10g289350 [Arachis hypogaea]|nr:uncharacterized protein DS421_10g289350 [Arachis hypogaea]